jgi:acyl-phosphate glycerol 3-phosphate acyltransferase
MALLEQLQSVAWERAAACGLGAYLLGCFSTGYYLVLARTGCDIRRVDSGATGARNVSRVLGATGFFLTVAGDFGKGALAVWAAGKMCGNDFAAALALLAVVLGHIWPAQLRFQGGKGVATSLGGLLLFDWRLAVAYAVSFAFLFLLTRRTILPGLFAYACLPLVAQGFDPDPVRTTVIALLAGLVLVAHRNNFVEEIPALAAWRGATANPEEPKL